MALGHKTGGRAKGTPNQLTRTVKEAISLAAERLGGVDRLVEWAQEAPENERAFWVNIYPKLLPLQLTGDANNPVALSFKWQDKPKALTVDM